METYPPPYHEPTFGPSAEQLERDQILRRRTRLYIYLPLGIVSFIAVVLIVLILIGLFAPGIVGTAAFISAVADIIVILWIIPMILVVSILPITYIAYFVNRRQKRKLDPQTGPLAYRSRLQVFLWRIQLFMNRTQVKTDELAPKVAEPVTEFNAILAYLGAWLNILIRPFRGNTKHERDGNHDRYGNGT
ncbi:MAG: hypothetical protein JSV68_15535 [Anaerolineaceae bacterium]|jgi:uncharacterized membrane protein|nr:hypothetical protein [Chloroflexota bacterium]UCC50510.1 MAG: hypothetical protein JSV68_15535 [Anaerolineaceae bacterium]